jgi:hypothetical protein
VTATAETAYRAEGKDGDLNPGLAELSLGHLSELIFRRRFRGLARRRLGGLGCHGIRFSLLFLAAADQNRA